MKRRKIGLLVLLGGFLLACKSSGAGTPSGGTSGSSGGAGGAQSSMPHTGGTAGASTGSSTSSSGGSAGTGGTGGSPSSGRDGGIANCLEGISCPTPGEACTSSSG